MEKTHDNYPLHRLAPCEATLVHHYRMCSSRSQKMILGLAIAQSQCAPRLEADNVVTLRPAPAA